MSGKGGRKETRRAALSREDHALWGEVTKSIAPLRARPQPSQPIEPAEEAPRVAKKAAPPRPPAPPPKLAPKAPALANIDRRTKQRLSRGRTEIDARLDLHGMTQAAARTRLESFLKSAQARGHGLVLVITGKGRPPSRDSVRRGGARRAAASSAAMAFASRLAAARGRLHRGLDRPRRHRRALCARQESPLSRQRI